MKNILFLCLTMITFSAQASLMDRAKLLVRSKTATSKDSNYAGVKVMFKTSDSELQDKIHQELNAKLKFRSIRLRMDVVQLTKLNANQDLKKLQDLCRDYFERDIVHWCAINVGHKLQKSSLGKVAFKDQSP